MNNDKQIAQHYHALLELMGENPAREGLVNTPKRAARALEYVTQGYRQNLDSIVNNAIFESDNDQYETYVLNGGLLLEIKDIAEIGKGYVEEQKV